MNPLQKLPDNIRLALYLLYAAAGPILLYNKARGWTGDAEINLWVGLGVAFGLTAASNITRSNPADPGEVGAMRLHVSVWAILAVTLAVLLGVFIGAVRAAAPEDSVDARLTYICPRPIPGHEPVCFPTLPPRP